MRARTVARGAVFLGALLVAIAAPSAPRAHAFSVAVHIYLANSIHDEVARNMESTGRPLIRLMGPDGRVVSVELDARDAEAILENPEFFRGGAIGPDNTVLTGLTDPSHSWMFGPFPQCGTLLDEAIAEEQRRIDAGTPASDVPLEERAYALGCFLHGITDNVAHHTVNFFTGETFTLYPIESASSGTLRFSLLNVVRHIATETRFQDGLEAQEAALTPSDRTRSGVMSTPLTSDALRHRIATGLVGRVYFDQGTPGPNALWDDFTNPLIEGKRAALRSALGLGPTDDIVAALAASTDPFGDDEAAIAAYVDYLGTGGLTPPDYILMLPEIVRDIGRFYTIVNAQGRRVANEISAIRFLEKRLLENAFAPRNAAGEVDWTALGASRFEDVMALKAMELAAVVPAFLQSIENISNLNLTVGIINATREQRLEALAPLTERLEAITDIHYDILFSATTIEIIENVQYVQDAIQAILDLIKMRVREFVIERVMLYLDDLVAQAEALRAEVRAHLDAALEAAQDRVRERVLEIAELGPGDPRRAQLEQLGIALGGGTSFFERFLTSGAFMNAFNSAAGVLTEHEVVAPHRTSMFEGPVSFDASWQIEYNQLALCPELRSVFYPCGASAGEMLQPDFRHCVAIPEVAGELDPPVECHDGSQAVFTDAVSMTTCAPVELDVLLASSAPFGSYTLAFPPSMLALGAEQPSCRIDILYAIDELPPGGDGGGVGPGIDGGPGGPGGEDGGGCGCSVPGGRTAESTAPFAILGVTAGVFARRRRRR